MKLTLRLFNGAKASRFALFAVAAVALLSFASCDKDDDDDNDDVYARIQPSKPKPSWGPTIAQQMQAVIETLDSIALPINTLTTERARTQPSPADAVMRVMRNFSVPMPAVNVDTVGRDIPVTGGTIHLRIYTPRTGKASYPMIVYYHGGGFVIATIDTYNASAQALAEKAEAVLVSVEYRKGPEFKFPTAHNDAYAAYVWTLRNASTIKGDSTKVAVAGESAGGNLAVNVAMMARDNGVRKPVHILSVYPLANSDAGLASKQQYVAAKPLSTPDLPWFSERYLNNMAEGADTRMSLVNANLTGLPRTTIVAAEIDPLQTEGMQLRDKLQTAGVTTAYRLYNGVTHEFFGMAAVVPQARDAQAFAVEEMKKSF